MTPRPMNTVPRPHPLDAFMAANARAANDMVRKLRGSPPPPPRPPYVPNVGDKVELTVTAYVKSIDGRTVALAATREPFTDSITLDACHASRLRLRQAAPAAPLVGDTITGRTLRETAWRRGTIIRDVADDIRYVLTGSGRWVDITTDGDDVDAYRFDTFEDGERFDIEVAPGKKDGPAVGLVPATGGPVDWSKVRPIFPNA